MTHDLTAAEAGELEAEAAALKAKLRRLAEQAGPRTIYLSRAANSLSTAEAQLHALATELRTTETAAKTTGR